MRLFSDVRWAKIWNFGKRGKIKKSYLGVFTNIHDLYLRWTLIFQWRLIEFLHKILKKIILKTAFYKSSNCVKFQDILWNRFSFDFLVFSGNFFSIFSKHLYVKCQLRAEMGRQVNILDKICIRVDQFFFVHH